MTAADPRMPLTDFPGVPGGGYCASNGLIVCACRFIGHPGELLMKNVFGQTACTYAELDKINGIDMTRSPRHFWTQKTFSKFSFAVRPGACPNTADQPVKQAPNNLWSDSVCL